jgi:hypothetical protein
MMVLFLFDLENLVLSARFKNDGFAVNGSG